MYAPQLAPCPAPVVIRLIGVLDLDLVTAFSTVERGLASNGGATVIVDVRDLDLLGERDLNTLLKTVGEARSEGRDLRFDAKGFAWRSAIRRELGMPATVDEGCKAAVRRTIIVAHSGKQRRR